MIWYKTFLPKLHEIVAPKRYVEIGIRHGYSLSISRDAKKIAIDPQYSEKDMQFDVANTEFFKVKSDAFFEEKAISESYDLAYIDGLHLFEYALRNYMNLENTQSRARSLLLTTSSREIRKKRCVNPPGGLRWGMSGKS